MMEIYTVSFFGHRQLDDFMGAERRLEKLIRELFAEREYGSYLLRSGQISAKIKMVEAFTVILLIFDRNMPI